MQTGAEAPTMVDNTGERFYEAELYRIKGELTLAQSSVQRLESGVQENQKAKIPDPKSQSLNRTTRHSYTPMATVRSGNDTEKRRVTKFVTFAASRWYLEYKLTRKVVGSKSALLCQSPVV